MTTSNIETEMYLPKTYIFERKDKAWSDVAYMTTTFGSATRDFVYLPKGLSLVTITATGLNREAMVRPAVWGPNSYNEFLTGEVLNTNPTSRVWSGQLSNPAEGNNGLWLKINARSWSGAAMATGSVSVQIINFPPEN